MNQRGALLFTVIMAALGGFLFGYQTSIISGAQLFLSKDFELSIFEEGFVVSIILIGALLGAASAGSLADRFGRKKVLFFTCILFVIGSWLAAVAITLDLLLIGRLITGLGVGITSLASPLYLSEISPSHKRGQYVSINQLMITIGILMAYIVNYLFAFDGGWRWMLALGMVPALVQGGALFFMPESPSWLSSHRRLRNQGELQGSWRDLLRPELRFLLVIGIVLSLLQQITGINAVIYYAPKIFEMAGFSTASYAILATVAIGLINVIATIFSVRFMDKWGRKRLLYISLVGMLVSLLLLSWAFFTSSEIIDTIAILSQMAYVAFFALGLGPVPWVVIAEIYPHKIRGRAMSIALFVNWSANYFVALTFLDLIKRLTPAGTFMIYAFFTLVAWWFTKNYLPETKNQSLDKIEEKFTHRRG